MYEKHHEMWEREVEKAADKLEEQMADQEDDQEEQEQRHKTIDTAELYDGIDLQLDQPHS